MITSKKTVRILLAAVRAIHYKLATHFEWSGHAQANYTSGFPLPCLPKLQYRQVSRAGHLKSFITLIIVCSCLSSNAQKTLSYSDKTYEQQIRTVQLFPNFGGTRDYLQSPATPMQEQNLILEFDDLQDNRNNYYVKLIHCNYDWTKSVLMDLDFLENYNENPITDYTFSINTHSRYIHYRYPVQPVKLPGNYLLIVYRNDKSDLVLSKRMMIYDNQIGMVKDNLFIGAGNLNSAKQQFNFDLDYSNLEILNPLETVHVTLRQNQRWDNAKFNLQPSFLRDNERKLEYRFLDTEKQFDGGNEFRFVDFRSLNYPGQNTGKIVKDVKPYELYVALDVPKSFDSYAYALYPDLNGNYLIENLDVGEPTLTGNYIYTTFYLKSPQPIDGEVYIIGAFNNYQHLEENKMKYNSTGYYENRQFLKQGLYNYQYEVISKTKPPTFIEGSHYQTENMYEVLIYNHPFRPNADLLIGYYLIPVNPR